MFHSQHEAMSQKLWAELDTTAVYILNRTGPTTVKGMSLYELWYGVKPNINQLRIIGNKCYVHVPKENRRKIDSKAVEGVFIGFEDNGYRVWGK
jgi:hypothetical protein